MHAWPTVRIQDNCAAMEKQEIPHELMLILPIWANAFPPSFIPTFYIGNFGSFKCPMVGKRLQEYLVCHVCSFNEVYLSKQLLFVLNVYAHRITIASFTDHLPSPTVQTYAWSSPATTGSGTSYALLPLGLVYQWPPLTVSGTCPVKLPLNWIIGNITHLFGLQVICRGKKFFTDKRWILHHIYRNPRTL